MNVNLQDLIDEREKKKERIMLLSLQRRQQQEEAKERKQQEMQAWREKEKEKEEARARKKEEQVARRAAILEQHRMKKALEDAEKEVSIFVKFFFLYLKGLTARNSTTAVFALVDDNNYKQIHFQYVVLQVLSGFNILFS